MAEATAPRGTPGESPPVKEPPPGGGRVLYPRNLPNSSYKYADEAKEMLGRFLELNPKNDRVWLVYLANCDWFVPGGYTPERRKLSFLFRGQPQEPVKIPTEQRAIIERAYTHCPENEGIKAWHDFVTSGDLVPPEQIQQLRSHLPNMGYN